MRSLSRSTWEHAIETVLLLGVCALAAVAVLPGMGVPVWCLWGIEALSGVVAWFVIWASTGNGAFSVSGLAFGLFLAFWTHWAEAAGLWHARVITVLLGGLIVFIPWTALASRTPAPKHSPEQAGPREISAAEKREEEFQDWGYLFTTAGVGGVEVLHVEETKAGQVVRIQLPDSGKVTMMDLKGAAHKMEVILRVREGAIAFETADHSADVIMRIRVRSAWAAKIPLLPEHYASSVNRPFAIGVYEDGTLATFTLREIHTLIAGTTGAGKSNLNNVIVGQLARCVDTLIWMIDMKGGRTARPWLQPWIEGLTGAPVLDWVATSRDEAELMMRSFAIAIDTRANSGIGGSKIVPDAGMPQIILICDEMADLFGNGRGKSSDLAPRPAVDGEPAVKPATNAKFIAMAEEFVQKGRSEAVGSVWATQRGTVTMAGSGDFKANCLQRIALRAAAESDLRSIIPDARVAQRAMATLESEAGVGVLVQVRKSSLLAKFFYFDHPDNPDPEIDGSLCDDGCVPGCPVYRTAMETGDIRPRLDKLTAGPLGEAYANRWKRAGRLLNRGPVAVLQDEAVDTSQFEDLMNASGMKDPDLKVNPARLRAREILSARGQMGATPKYLLDRMTEEGLKVPARETLQRWLRDDELEGLVHSAGDEFGRWKIGRKDNSRGSSAA